MAEYNTRDRSKLFKSGLVDTPDIKDLSVTLDKLGADVVSEFTFSNKTTSDLAEGTNLYYTEDRVDANIAGKTTDDLTEGSTNLYYTDTRARASISVTDNGGDGSLSYNSSTGEISYTGPSATEVRAHFSAGTGVDITDGVVSIGQPVATTDDVTFATINADSLQLDLAAGVTVGTGEIAWNETDATFNMGLLNGTVLQVGQEQHFYAKAVGAIPNGAVVMFAGAQGGHVLVTLADLSSPSFEDRYLVGIATNSIANGEFGYVTSFGKVNDLDTSAWAEGTILYPDPNVAGGLTPTAPVSPLHAVAIAAVTRQHAVVGSIMVRLETGAHLAELHDVYLTSPSNQQFIRYNSTNSRWENSTVTTSTIGEGTNLYYTDARARAALSASDGITYNSSTGAFTLTDTGVTAGTYGSDSEVPVITVNANGQITDLTTTSISGVSNVTYNGSTGVLTVETSSGSNYDVDLGVGTADSPDFTSVSANYIDLDTAAGAPAYAEGRVFYDNVNKALAVYNDESEITLQVGQESWVRIYNSTGSTISNGSVVSFYGSISGTPIVIPADASDYNKIRWVAGFATHEIANNSYGYITTFGKVNGLDTSAYNIGDSLYVSATTPGGVTTTPPTYPNYSVLVGGVVAVDSTNGALFVSIQNSTFPSLQVNADARVDGDLVISGNLQVLGATSTVTTSNIAVADNMIYMNQGVEANISNAVGDGTNVVYTTVNAHNYQSGWSVSVTGIDPSGYNGYSMTITAVTSNTFTVAKTTTGTYVSGGLARAKSSANPDVGFAAGYNDGSYHHAGLFRDASDGYWKFFQNYAPEPDAGPYIDTSDASFQLAPLSVDSLTASSATITNITGSLSGNAATATKWAAARTITLGGDLTGNVSIDGSGDVTLTATVAANSVALGTDTTGNYVADVTAGSYIVKSGTAGEGWSPTIAVDATSANTASKVVARDASGDFSAGTITAALSGNATTASALQTSRTISLTGDVTGSVSFNGSGDAAIATTIAANSVALGTDTTGNYMIDVAAGGGISVSHTQGEGSTATISHSDTSVVANLTAATNTFISGITFDTYGHVQTVTTGTPSGFASSTHYHDRIYNGASGSSSYLALSSGNELEYYNASGVIDILYLQYSGTAAQLKGPGGAQIWMDSNDGSGSGLDADLLDGQHGSYYAPNSSLVNYLPLAGGTCTGVVNLYGGAKISVQEATDGGNSRGIFLWQETDSNWGIYMSTSGSGKSLSGGTATASIDGRTSHQVRFRAANSSTNGFVWENSSETALMSLTGDSGNLYVKGTLYAAAKSFLIDHPTKPGMKLRYGSLEGPENGVYVRGKLKGGNVIELPEYWAKLVDPDSITVQLTPIGKHQKLYVEDIRDNKVYIANDGFFAGEINCFYYILAERCDVDKLEVEIY